VKFLTNNDYWLSKQLTVIRHILKSYNVLIGKIENGFNANPSTSGYSYPTLVGDLACKQRLFIDLIFFDIFLKNTTRIQTPLDHPRHK
jgi:hypothetical protein